MLADWYTAPSPGSLKRFSIWQIHQPRSSSHTHQSWGNMVISLLGHSAIVVEIHAGSRLAPVEPAEEMLDVLGILGEEVGPIPPLPRGGAAGGGLLEIVVGALELIPGPFVFLVCHDVPTLCSW